MRKGGLPLNRKFIILSLYFFSTICLFSVGFSSWTICMGDKLTAKGNIVAEDVFNYNKYIEHVGTTPFSYFNTGFVEYDSNNRPIITNVGSITFEYKIHTDACESKYGNYVKFNFKIGYNGTPSWSKINNQDPLINNNMTVVATLNGAPIVADAGSSNDNLSYTFDLTNLSGYYTFKITYTFTYPKAPGTDPNEPNKYNICDGFEEIASCFRDDNIMFSLEVGIDKGSASSN